MARALRRQEKFSAPIRVGHGGTVPSGQHLLSGLVRGFPRELAVSLEGSFDHSYLLARGISRAR